MTLSPIARGIMYAGKPGLIITAAASNSSDYDPTKAEDFTPGADGTQQVLAMIASPAMREGMPNGATTAYTIDATTLPTGLMAGKSRFRYPLTGGIDYVIVEYRKREWLGEIDGYTLFLRK